MNKKLGVLSILSIATMGVTMIAICQQNDSSMLFAVQSLTDDKNNEYGCKGNCTGEYEIWDVKQIMDNEPYGTTHSNVRFKVKYLGEKYGNEYFEDCFQNFSRNDIDLNLTSLLSYEDGTFGKNGKSYQIGDTVNIYGTVSKGAMYCSQGLKITNLVCYGVNNDVDTTLLKPVTYIN